ncbi:hypothetical protein JCM6882_002133 [Rhodosporidiobolus microsporus]
MLLYPRPCPLLPILPLLAALLALLFAAGGAHAAPFYSPARKHELRELAAETWRHAYGAYKRVAFPEDEVLPLSCGKQGHDRRNTENAAVNDVMGDYALTLVDSLDTFAMLNDRPSFESAIRETIAHVSFNVDSRVQVFEVTIRMMGGLLSGHLLAQPPSTNASDPSTFSSSIKGFALPWYRGELLRLARDLGERLLPAFETPTGIPFARVHLQRGLRGGREGKAESPETCSAGAGSLLLEFITLSRLTSDPRFELAARRAFFAVWNARSEIGLVGNTIDARTGGWMHPVSGVGAGVDSFFEYAAKAYVLTGEEDYRRVWEEAYAALQRYSRAPDGFWFRNTHMHTGALHSLLTDSLSAFFPGVLALMGDLEGAIKAHAPFAFIWKRYGGLPELWDTGRRAVAHGGYPLRPEFIESNMYLYQATNDDYYLSIAERILHDLNNRTRVDCGFAALLNVETGELEDKMPSFVTAETLKYLYLTFDENNPFLRDDSAFVFTTEGHPLEIPHSPRAHAPSKHRNRKKRVFAPPPPSSSSSNSSANSSSTTCPAHLPLYDARYHHFLSLSVERRNDWEHARWLANFEPDLSEGGYEREVSEGRWSESGWCEVPQGEDPTTTLTRTTSALSLFQSFLLSHLRTFARLPSPAAASSAAASIHSSLDASASASSSSISSARAAFEGDRTSASSSSSRRMSAWSTHSSPPPAPQDLVIHSIAGLRFSLLRHMPGAESYIISKVGPHEVPKGGSVVIKDKHVLAGLQASPEREEERRRRRERRVERVGLSAERAPKGSRLPTWEERERVFAAAEEAEEAHGGGRGKLERLFDALMAPLGGSGGGASAPSDEGDHAPDCGCGGAAEGEGWDMNDAWEEVDDAGVPYALHIPALAASFGPSLLAPAPLSVVDASWSSDAGEAAAEEKSPRFVLDGRPLPLVLPRYSPYGCEPHHPPPLPSGSSSPPSDFSSASTPSAPSANTDAELSPSPNPSPHRSLPPNPLSSHLLLLHRGHCSFALKAHHAALSGASGVVLISSPSPLDDDPRGDGFVVPSADAGEEGEETIRALVPLVLVGNSTGRALEEMVRSAAAAREERVRIVGEDGGAEREEGGKEIEEAEEEEVFVSVHRMEEDEDELEDAGGVVLGGYVVRNIKLWRGK